MTAAGAQLPTVFGAAVLTLTTSTELLLQSPPPTSSKLPHLTKLQRARQQVSAKPKPAK